MPSHKVVLTDYHQDMIDRLVKSGRFENPNEVLYEGLRLVEQMEELDAAKLQALREAARVGFADLDEGRFTDVSADDLEEHIARLGESALETARRTGAKGNG